MRVPSSIQFKNQINSMSKQLERITKVTDQINSGKKISISSEDPVLAQKIKTTKNNLSSLDSYKNNMILSVNRTGLFESSIKGGMNEVSRVMELIKKAQSDTTTNEERNNIANELEGVLNNLASYANTADANGDFIFSGNSTHTRPFVLVGSQYQYVGNRESSHINASSALSVIFQENGQSVFGDIKLGNGVYTISQGATPNVGTAEASIGSVPNPQLYVEDNYTVSFVTNSEGKLAYQVIGAKSGQVIPAPPLTSPNDAPTYKEGVAISFNGINFSMKGTPALTDTFVVSPSGKQNALETINQIIATLRKPISTDSDKAAFHQKMGEFGASVQGINNHFAEYLNSVGYRARELESHEKEMTAEISNQTILLDKYESADIGELYTEYTQRMLSVQVTQQTYVKMQNLFSELMKLSG